MITHLKSNYLNYVDELTINNIDLTNYNSEQCRTESSAIGTILFIRNHLLNKTRNDLNICKFCELELTFIETIYHKKSNILVGCIYSHSPMDLHKFNNYYLNELLHKLSSENKSVILLGDFNVDLMKSDNHHPTNEFRDSLSSHLFLPHITKPNRKRDFMKTLIANIFSANFTDTISDHLTRFIILPNIFSNPASNKSNI